MAELHTTEEGRAEIRQNALDVLNDPTTSVASMLLCGMILSLLDDIDILLEKDVETRTSCPICLGEGGDEIFPTCSACGKERG